ncbi:hypothetical protein G3M48_004259 [Beauveria asiatica]|uniref:WRKY domain-containing protein n=1 Tax=Beauveria asiatica TaxID=1069075 RepID=A0AAW0RU73_9HYPO
MASPNTLEEEPFKTYEDALRALHGVANSRGYAITIAGSTKFPDGRPKSCIFHCDRGGRYRLPNPENSRYSTKTKARGCECRGKIKLNSFDCRYYVSFTQKEHNHELAEDPASLTRIRRQSHINYGLEAVGNLITEKSKQGKFFAHEIAASIHRDHPEILINGADVRSWQGRLARSQRRRLEKG